MCEERTGNQSDSLLVHGGSQHPVQGAARASRLSKGQPVEGARSSSNLSNGQPVKGAGRPKACPRDSLSQRPAGQKPVQGTACQRGNLERTTCPRDSLSQRPAGPKPVQGTACQRGHLEQQLVQGTACQRGHLDRQPVQGTACQRGRLEPEASQPASQPSQPTRSSPSAGAVCS